VEPVGWRALVARLFVLGALAVSLIVGWGALADPLVDNPGRAEATVLSMGTNPDGQAWAGVRFDTPRGPIVTRIAVAAPPAVGDSLSIVYDRSAPGLAARAETQRSLAEALVVPAVLALPAVVFGPRMIRSGRRRRKLTPLRRSRSRLQAKATTG
jgi:hypothetical protein